MRSRPEAVIRRARRGFAGSVAGVALLLGGCQAPHPLTWVSLDKNTYRQPAVIVEHRSHGPYPPRHVEYYRWMYGADAFAAPLQPGPMLVSEVVVESPSASSRLPEPPPAPRSRSRADARMRPGRRLAPAPPSSIEDVPAPDMQPPLPTDAGDVPSGPPLPSPPEPLPSTDAESAPSPPSGFVPQPFQNGLAPPAQMPTFTDGEADLPTADANTEDSSHGDSRSASSRPVEERRAAVRLVPELVLPVREAVDYRRPEYVVSGAAESHSQVDADRRRSATPGDLGDWPRTPIQAAVADSEKTAPSNALDELAPTPEGPKLVAPWGGRPVTP